MVMCNRAGDFSIKNSEYISCDFCSHAQPHERTGSCDYPLCKPSIYWDEGVEVECIEVKE
jgi:hypothetical protein